MINAKKNERLEIRISEEELTAFDIKRLAVQEICINLGRDPEKAKDATARAAILRHYVRFFIQNDAAKAASELLGLPDDVLGEVIWTETLADVTQRN